MKLFRSFRRSSRRSSRSSRIVALFTILLLFLLTASFVLADSGPTSPLPTPTEPWVGVPTRTPTPVPPPNSVLIGELEASSSSPETLLQLIATGTSAVGGVLVAFVLRQIPGFNELPSSRKRTVAAAVGIGIPAIAGLLVMYVPQGFWDAIRPVWSVVALSVIAYITQQAAYLGFIRRASPPEVPAS